MQVRPHVVEQRPGAAGGQAFSIPNVMSPTQVMLTVAAAGLLTTGTAPDGCRPAGGR